MGFEGLTSTNLLLFQSTTFTPHFQPSHPIPANIKRLKDVGKPAALLELVYFLRGLFPLQPFLRLFW
jgi:hypothetical protein